jgi:GGDEF domain-containing protein
MDYPWYELGRFKAIIDHLGHDIGDIFYEDG